MEFSAEAIAGIVITGFIAIVPAAIHLDRKWSRKPKIKILMSTNNYLASSGSKPYRLIEVKAINVGELPTTLSMAVDSIRKYSVPSAQNKQAKHMNPIRLKWN